MGAAALLLAASAPLGAQEANPTAERARQAFQSAQPAAAEDARAEQEQTRELARQAAEGLGVELLSTRIIEVGDRRLVAARVMEPGADSNVAFLVQTLVLDPDGGQVLGVFPGTEDEIGALPSIAAGAPVPAEEPDSDGGAE